MAKTIEPGREYSLGEIVREKLIPNVNNIVAASRLVRSTRFAKTLNAVKTKRGVIGVQYRVKGANIIKLIKELNGKNK